MSDNKERQSDGTKKTTEDQGISTSRRNFTQASLLASPVLMSVVSRPVFGVGCLSNMLSGNLSDPNRGECTLGLNTQFWQENPGNWPIAAGFLPDNSLPSTCSDCINGATTARSGSGVLSGNKNVGNKNVGGNRAAVQADVTVDSTWKCTGGALFNSHFPTGPRDALDRSMYEILCTEGSSDEALIITALLNAMTDPTYVLSVDQVTTLWADPTLGGQIVNFQSFLTSTWT